MKNSCLPVLALGLDSSTSKYYVALKYKFSFTPQLLKVIPSTQLPAPFTPGLYIIRVNSGSKLWTGKLIIK
ncbi:MAG: hypothetical protein WCR72_16375 [Bacteroidota bacterium]